MAVSKLTGKSLNMAGHKLKSNGQSSNAKR